MQIFELAVRLLWDTCTAVSSQPPRSQRCQQAAIGATCYARAGSQRVICRVSSDQLPELFAVGTAACSTLHSLQVKSTCSGNCSEIYITTYASQHVDRLKKIRVNKVQSPLIHLRAALVLPVLMPQQRSKGSLGGEPPAAGSGARSR
jgi:hypothetical protein